MSIKILLADDHKILREGLRALLEKHSDIKIVAEADNGRTAVQLAKELSPDIVIMDITMPDLNGIEATRKIIADVPQVKVIVLSMHSDRRLIREMLNAGASGYLVKDCIFKEILSAIHEVRNNKIYLGSTIANGFVKDSKHRISDTDLSAFSILTPREREVLQLISEGKSTSQIASILNISIKTVETFRQHIMEKLDIHSVAQLTKYAIREKLTSI